MYLLPYSAAVWQVRKSTIKTISLNSHFRKAKLHNLKRQAVSEYLGIALIVGKT